MQFMSVSLLTNGFEARLVICQMESVIGAFVETCLF